MRLRFHSRLLGLLSASLLLSALPAFAGPSPNGAIHQRALQAFHALHARSPHAEAEWQARQPGIHMLLGLDEPLLGDTTAQRGERFLRANEALLGVSAGQLRPLAPTVSNQRTVLRYQQIARMGGQELRVLDAEVTLTFDNANGHLLRVLSEAVPVQQLAAGVVTREQAAAKASQSAAGATFARALPAAAEQAVIVGHRGARLVWVVHVPGASLQDLRTLAVDAVTGDVTRLPNRVLD